MGYLISAMTFPAVPMHQSLLRMTVIPGVLTKEVIDGFCDALEVAMKRCEFLDYETKQYMLFDKEDMAKRYEEEKERKRKLFIEA